MVQSDRIGLDSKSLDRFGSLEKPNRSDPLTGLVIVVAGGYEHGGKNISNLHAYGLLVLLSVYLVGFVCSWGLLGWLVPSEMFPLEILSMGHYIMVGISVFSTFIIAQYSLGMFCKFKFGIFYFFAAFVLIMTFFVMSFLHETKDIPIQEMPKVWAQHWFWKRYYYADEVYEKEVECDSQHNPIRLWINLPNLDDIFNYASNYNTKEHTDRRSDRD